VSWRRKPGEWRTQPIGEPLDEPVTAVRFGRSAISTHNSSAPDLLFEAFGTASRAR
jgi:hypothetical protein